MGARVDVGNPPPESLVTILPQRFPGGDRDQNRKQALAKEAF